VSESANMVAPLPEQFDPMTKEETTSGEDRLIARFFRPLAKHPGAFGLTDDAAVITPPAGANVVFKIDPIVGGVHFFPTIRPSLLRGRRCGSRVDGALARTF
jgi:hypothetical protein